MIFRLFKRIRQDRRRLLFRFYDGRRYRRADPLVISDNLANDSEYLPRHLESAMLGDQDAIKLCGRVACRVFDVLEATDNEGLTLSERLELLLTFTRWIAALKKNTTRFAG